MLSFIMKYRTKRESFILASCSLLFFCLGWLAHFGLYGSGKGSIDSALSPITSAPTLITPKIEVKQYIDVPDETEVALESVLNKYEKTMRSCLGSKCFEEPVRQVERVGLLAPLFSGGELMLNTLKSRIDNSKVSITYDTHVPAYGYGKNHGWTRIIRLVQPIVPHALALTEKSLGKDGMKGPLFRDTFEAQLKQLMRWHCRLSHVAAHTKLLTIFSTDLLSKPMVEIEKMLTFIGTFYDRHALISDDARLRDEIGREFSLSYSKDSDSTVRALATFSIDSELNATKLLTKWPCPTFRGLEKDYKNAKLYMTSQQLSANCSDPFVTCSVQYDRSGG